MPTIAELQIKVDSSPVEQGTKALNDFATAAERASTATDKKRKSDEGLSTATKQTAVEVDAAAKAAEKQNREFEALLGKIDPLTKKLNELARQEALLFANKESLPTARFEQYNASIQESVNKLIGLGDAQKTVTSGSDAVPDRLMRIAEAAVNATRAQQGLTDAYRGASEAEQGLVSSGAVNAANERAEAALREHNAKRELTEATKQAAAAEKAQADSLQDLLSKIDPTTRKLNDLEDLQKQLSVKRDLGLLDNDTFDRYNKTLELNRATLARYSEGLQTTGKTAKETAFALRGLPAQFTDIVVSLQGGQAPLTVLLQQGGQIKDMFGGIVPAFKAVGGALLAMITPVTLVAAGLSALAIATYSGSKELTAFNRAVIESAGYAGVSVNKFAAMRDSIADTGINAGKAAEALTLLASGGQVVGTLFTDISTSAVLFEKATGQALSKTIDDFNAIGKDPVAAAVRLDEKYKFLTSSVLAQASALERNGQESEAATLLQQRLSDQVSETAKEMIDQAGYIERAWVRVKGAISGTWDALKGIGREQSANDRIAELNRIRKSLQEGIDLNAKLGLKGFGKSKEISRVAEIDKEIAQIKQRNDYEQFGAENRAKAEDARRDAVSAQASALRRNETNLKGVAKAENELRKVRLENSKIEAGGNVTDDQRRISAENEARAVEELRKAKEKDAKVKPTTLDTRAISEVKNGLAEITAEYDGYYKRVTAIGQAGIVSDEATFNSQKAILEAQRKAVAESYDDQIAQINKLRDNKKNSASQNISLDNQLSKAESDRVIALEKIDAKQDALASKEQGRIEKRTASVAAYKAALDAQLESLQEQGARATDGVGRGDAASAVAKQLAENDRAFDKQQRQLADTYGKGSIDAVEYADKLKDLQDTHTAMTDQILKNDADIKAANGDWTNGFTKAVENAAEDGRNFAKSTEQAVSGAFNSMGDALAEFATTGKLNFRSLASSILADMAKIAARQAASSALSSLFGFASSAASTYFGGGANGFASGSAAATSSSLGASSAGYGSNYFPQAKGGAWDGGTKFFAQGGVFTNSIVSSATSFGMAGGGKGVMGEAGPEAIVPLARASDGSLGVRMIGNNDPSQMGSGVLVNIYITGDGTTTDTNDTNYADFGKQVGDIAERKYKELQARDLSAGGDLRRAINER